MANELTTLSVGGQPYRCPCGCNVFRVGGHVDGTPRIRYACNACPTTFEGEPAGPVITNVEAVALGIAEEAHDG